jgi:hypothetical protein
MARLPVTRVTRRYFDRDGDDLNFVPLNTTLWVFKFSTKCDLVASGLI